jgi:hypothetical protein
MNKKIFTLRKESVLNGKLPACSFKQGKDIRPFLVEVCRAGTQYGDTVPVGGSE